MPLKIQPSTNKDFKPVNAGNHVAILISVIDLGHQEVEWKGEKKIMPKVRFTWELCHELKEFEGVPKPQVIGATYTLSMGSKAKLRPIIEGILGTKLEDSEAYDFSFERFESLLGKASMVNVVHSNKGEKVYANIASVAPVPKGVKVPPQFNDSVIFDIERDKDSEKFDLLPKFIQEIIGRSQEANEKPMDEETKKQLDYARKNHDMPTVDYPEEEINASEIPF